MRNPLCPNCCRPMRVARTIEPLNGEVATNVFECRVCNVTFVTQDHMSVVQRAS